MILFLINPVQIISFNPTVSSFQAMISKFSAGEEPHTPQSVFYADLVTRAVQTVRKMKQGQVILTDQLVPIFPYFRGQLAQPGVHQVFSLHWRTNHQDPRHQVHGLFLCCLITINYVTP